MELKSKPKSDIEEINKFTSYQLPSKFKIVGLVVFIISLISSIMLDVYLKNDQCLDLFKRIVVSTAILGLLIISISKEKIEDELMTKIRTQSYNYAVIGTVLFYLIIPFINFIIATIFSSTPKIEGSSDISILGLMLSMQILTFRKLKRAYNEK